MSVILAVETSTDACSVALSKGHDIFYELVVEPQAHAKLILGLVDQVLHKGELQLQNVDAIAFGHGPGSFTGLRIAASVAQGLAFGAGKPIIAISTLQALAQQALVGLESDVLLLPIIDARMQEVYWGLYQNTNDFAVALQADCLQKPAELSFDRHKKYCAFGTGAKVYRELLQSNNSTLQFNHEVIYPRANEVAVLAQQEFALGRFLKPEQAIPVYIRNDVAQTGKKNPD